MAVWKPGEGRGGVGTWIINFTRITMETTWGLRTERDVMLRLPEKIKLHILFESIVNEILTLFLLLCLLFIFILDNIA